MLANGAETKRHRVKFYVTLEQAFFGHFFKNSARQKLTKFQNSARFFVKTQIFSKKTQFSGKTLKILLNKSKYKTQKIKNSGQNFEKTHGFEDKTQFPGKSICVRCRKPVQKKPARPTM